MAIWNLKWLSSEDLATQFSFMTNEELIDKLIHLGRESNFERYLFPHEREELRGLKVVLLARLRDKNKPRGFPLFRTGV